MGLPVAVRLGCASSSPSGASGWYAKEGALAVVAFATVYADALALALSAKEEEVALLLAEEKWEAFGLPLAEEPFRYRSTSAEVSGAFVTSVM